MRLGRRWSAMSLLFLLVIPRLALAQGGSDSREKFEKVSEILPLFRPSPAGESQTSAPAKGFTRSALLEPLDPAAGSPQSM